MDKIGNILYAEDLVNHTKVDYINYYHITSVGLDEEVDYSIPTLFVGWNFLKNSWNNTQLSPKEDLSILEKKIITNLIYWEFSFNENKQQHILGVDDLTISTPRIFRFGLSI